MYFNLIKFAVYLVQRVYATCILGVYYTYITDDDEHFEPLNNFSDNVLV